MSFKYGGTKTDSLAGVTATLVSWPSLGGLSVESEDIPGRDGRFYSGATRSHSKFVFDVIVSGTSPADAAAKRDAFVGVLDPSEGPRPLVVEIDTAWTWPDVLPAAGLDWERVAWDRAVGFTLRAELTLETQGDASAREVAPQKVTYPSAGSFTLSRGNTAAFPRIEFASGAAAVLKVGAFTLNIAATPAGNTVVLDWNDFDFSIRNPAGKRIESAVRYMSNYKQPSLRQGKATTVSVSRGGSFVPVTMYPNARRI